MTLINRPRRFGKTLAMSMLHEFFDITQDSRDIFEGLSITKNQAICGAWMNQYPVIFLSLKEFTGPTFSHAINKLALLIRYFCNDCSYLLDSDIADGFKHDFHRLMMKESSQEEMEDALRLLSRALHDYHGKKPIILIDEYDVPLNYAQRNGYYDEMVGFIRSFLGAALKTNPYLNFAVLTGCLHISKESIFTGLNNFACYGISDHKFADKFGFTQTEVDELLAVTGFTEKKSEFKDWYNGYCFGDETQIYCPWDVLYHASNLQVKSRLKPQSYWKNSSSNDIVKTLIEQATEDTRQKVSMLLAGQTIQVKIDEQLTYDSLFESADNLWSVLYTTGYLTKTPKQEDDLLVSLRIPNKEVKTIYEDTLQKWLADGVIRYDIPAWMTAIWQKDALTVEDKLRDMLYDTMSYFDSAENFYHGFLAGRLSALEGLSVVSNREQGKGRSDLYVEEPLKRRAAIVELKAADNEDQLEELADVALTQIEAMQYEKGVPKRIRDVVKVGIAFCKKECAVKIG